MQRNEIEKLGFICTVIQYFVILAIYIFRCFISLHSIIYGTHNHVLQPWDTVYEISKCFKMLKSTRKCELFPMQETH